MPAATLRFYAELNDFLKPPHRQTAIPYSFELPVAIKHPIEALGVPHTEVELILANGRPATFHTLLQDGDRLSIYPQFRALELAGLDGVRPPPAFPPRFVADNHLGQLATYLRLLGFDTLYHNDYEDAELARLAFDEGRVLLTRDRRLLMRKAVVYGHCLRSMNPRRQLAAVLRRYHLEEAIDPWRRCLRCNGLLLPVAKEDVLDRLEPKTRLYYDEFHMCQACRRIYWKGSHTGPMERQKEEVRQELATPENPRETQNVPGSGRGEDMSDGRTEATELR
jgi:uncharacterized protein with PIN domain